MTKQEFSSWIVEAETLHSLSDRSGYYEGYVEGLRQSYYREAFGIKGLGDRESPDDNRIGSGHRRGYIDGLRGVKPCLIYF
jgi:hypothetical protein